MIMTQPTMQYAPIDATSITERLRDRLHGYRGLEDSEGTLTLLKEINRRFCNLYIYRLSSQSKCPSLVVKVPVGPGDIAYAQKLSTEGYVDRPRLFGRADPTTKSAKEFAALKRIEGHFGDNDPRFGTVHIYDLFHDEQAMVMEWVDQPSLRQLLYNSHRFRNVQLSKKLEVAFRHMGGWLRKHHDLPPLEHCETRNTSRDDYLESIERFSTYLEDRAGCPTRISEIHRRLIENAQEHLPDTIPTGQVHGDYAPRNAFIDADNRVTVFDTPGRFEAPIFEDLAKLLMTVKASGPQLLSGGLLYNAKQLRRYEENLLEGYFLNEPIPYKCIRLFEAQLLLEHWAATVYRYRDGRGFRRIAKGVRKTLWQRGFQAYLSDILTDMNAHSVK